VSLLRALLMLWMKRVVIYVINAVYTISWQLVGCYVKVATMTWNLPDCVLSEEDDSNGVTHSSAMQHPIKNPLPRDLANTYEGYHVNLEPFTQMQSLISLSNFLKWRATPIADFVLPRTLKIFFLSRPHALSLHLCPPFCFPVLLL
jgi:hypothetical protein